MNLIIPLSIFIFTFELGLTIPVNDDKLNPLVDDEYPMVIRNGRISGHSGRMMMERGTNVDADDKSLDDEIQVTTISSVTTATTSDQDEIQSTSSSSSEGLSIDGFKLGQSEIVDVIPDQYNPQPDLLHAPNNPSTDKINQQKNQLNPLTGTDQFLMTLSSSTINETSSKINPPETESKNLPEVSTTSSTTTTTSTTTRETQETTQATTTTTGQSFHDRVSSMIEDSFAQTTKLLIDLEEQIKLSQFNQQIGHEYPPLNIFTSTSSHSISSASSLLTSSSLPLAYGFKLSAHNFLFRPLIRGSSIVSSAVKFNHNTNDDDILSLSNPDDIKLDAINYENLDENANPENGNSIINHQSHHWYGNQKQNGIQMQSMIDEVTRIEQNVEVLITELVSNRRYVTAAVFRSLLNYLRRLRISLERLQSRMAIIGVGNAPQGSSVGGSISSGISSSVSSIASSVSSSFLPEQASGPLGGSSGGITFNPIASGSAMASTYIESIRVRMNRVTEEIRTLINRMRLSFSSSSASSSPTVSSSSLSSSDPSPSPSPSPPAPLPPTPSSTTTKSPSSPTSSSSFNRKASKYHTQ